MNKTTTNLLLMLITIVAGTYFYIMYCSECGTLKVAEDATEQTITNEPKATVYPFSFQNSTFSYTTRDNYNFKSSSANIVMPLSEEVTKGIYELGNYLQTNNGSVVNIMGYYTDKETNNSAFPNLGLARANAIKNDFAAKGISTLKINTIGKLMNNMIAEDGTYRGAASFSIDQTSTDTEDELEALYKKINEDPLILYFSTAESSIDLNYSQRLKVADISKYLDKVPTSTVNIVGHTDNTGTAATNKALGLDRANFAKYYLTKNSIAADKIMVSSKGQDEPIASNATEEGRNKNRRTIITLNH